MTGANPADSESPEAGEADRWRGVCVCWKLHSREGRERETGSGNCLWFGTTRLRVESCGSVGLRSTGVKSRKSWYETILRATGSS